jgi:hypothetical protein
MFNYKGKECSSLTVGVKRLLKDTVELNAPKSKEILDIFIVNVAGEDFPIKITYIYKVN